MAEKYNHSAIEKKWQEVWEEEGAFRAEDFSKKPKQYLLVEFPYPSGDGLHTGHVRSYAAMDIIARKRRAEGQNVLYPIGWDAFGLPTENYALKTGKDPRIVTKENTDNFRRQLKLLGLSFDWSREVNTTDPKYYKWTQWIFLQLYKHGLAYKTKTLINWCPKDKIGLANEEVVDGSCERCGTAVEKREKEQWMLAITKYAQRLYDDLNTVNYIEAAKAGQRNWIGPSEGAEIRFKIQDSGIEISVFTTRPDTLFGATYLVLAPEHPETLNLESKILNRDEVTAYINDSKNKSDIDRSAEGKEKTGVELKGIKAINPANKQEIPVYIADYVLGHYGTGAIMAVPAHDERDFEFAQRFGIPVVQVVKSDQKLYTGTGVLINSGEFSGMDSEEAKKKITEAVGGKIITTYKLRDWVFSRQRYWGEPIPMINCSACGWQPVPEDQLPVELPRVDKYEPTDTGESPLANITEWINTTCPKCGGAAKRETDVMPNWAGSSWYYLRYVDPKNDATFAAPDKLKYWTPVDWYNGGMEHTTLHLLYSRFWHKFLFDIGEVPTSEPYMKRTSHGLVLAQDGSKMSKSAGNVVNPDGAIQEHGADALRLYEMFMGPFDQPVAWSSASVVGVRRFLERVWKLAPSDSPLATSTDTLLNQTIKKVGEDIEQLKMNTAVSALMILLNELEKTPSLEAYKIFLQLLFPFAPHMASELAQMRGISLAEWPAYDASKLISATVTVAVQVNGKVRGKVELAPDAAEAEALQAARAVAEKWLTGPEKKAIYVPGKIINLVV